MSTPLREVYPIRWLRHIRGPAKRADEAVYLRTFRRCVWQLFIAWRAGLVALQEANADRVEQAHEFQTVVNDQRATQEVLFKVLDKLAKVERTP